MFEDDPKATYRWEKGVSKTWDTVQEDEAGNLITTTDDRERSYRAKQNRITKSIRRGLIRYMVIAIDSSKSASDTDYKPCRLEVTKACVQKFIGEYYDQNPISQLGVIATRDRTSDRVTELSGNPKNHIHMIKAMKNMSGLASLQNTMLLGMSMLRHIPNYGHREMLIVFSSLSTCDPGDIFASIKEAKAQKVRISVICLVAEVFVCRQIAELTGGTFAVALDATHLSELLLTHTIPPPEVQRNESLVTDFIYMGFPKRTFDSHTAFGFEGKKMKLSANAYICPRCSTRTTDIPTQCCVCNLQLNSSSHIARSHHHLFPVPNYVEYEVKESVVTDVSDASDTSGALTLKLKRPGVEKKRGTTKTYTAVCLDHSHTHSETHKLENAANESKNGTAADCGVVGATDNASDGDERGDIDDVKNASPLENEVVLGSVSVSNFGVVTSIGKSSNSSGDVDKSTCRGCLESLCRDNKLILRCPLCRHFFCVECDLFVHDSLHNCPGCK